MELDSNCKAWEFEESEWLNYTEEIHYDQLHHAIRKNLADNPHSSYVDLNDIDCQGMQVDKFLSRDLEAYLEIDKRVRLSKPSWQQIYQSNIDEYCQQISDFFGLDQEQVASRKNKTQHYHRWIQWNPYDHRLATQLIYHGAKIREFEEIEFSDNRDNSWVFQIKSGKHEIDITC